MNRLPFAAFLLLATTTLAEDWGAYQIVPASAPEFVLEVVGSTNEGDLVSINKPANAPHQKWIIQPASDGWNWLSPASQPDLALAADGAATKNGTKVLLAKKGNSDTQLWSFTKQDDGSYALEPKHA